MAWQWVIFDPSSSLVVNTQASRTGQLQKRLGKDFVKTSPHLAKFNPYISLRSTQNNCTQRTCSWWAIERLRGVAAHMQLTSDWTATRGVAIRYSYHHKHTVQQQQDHTQQRITHNNSCIAHTTTAVALVSIVTWLRAPPTVRHKQSLKHLDQQAVEPLSHRSFLTSKLSHIEALSKLSHNKACIDPLQHSSDSEEPAAAAETDVMQDLFFFFFTTCSTQRCRNTVSIHHKA